jgi:act minimal PKS ketosynthase (KS/KS alpha)
MSRRAVITGVGVVAPGDPGAQAFWSLLSDGRTATRIATLFDPAPYRGKVVAECNFDPVRSGLSPREIRRMDRTSQLGVVAGREALADAGVADARVPPDRIGVSVGNALGNSMSMEREYTVISDLGRKWLVDLDYATPHLLSVVASTSLAAELAWLSGAEGPCCQISTGCCAGIDAVGHAFELIREGSCDLVVAGASDAPIYPITIACFDRLRATSNCNDDPGRACKPFDRRRNGLVLGEGAACLIVEEYEHARRRGAKIYCEVLGHGARANAYHMTGLQEDGRELSIAIRAALEEARMDPERIDYINAHGSGTPQNDRHETAAYKRSLGDHAFRVPVSSIKSMVGHSLGAIGSIEIAACALAFEHQVVPPTANLAEPDPSCDLDYVPNTARDVPLDVILSAGSGFGGFQSAIVLAREVRA